MHTDTLAPAGLRVRFAPSPTGYLHTGGARTALFNWLWARKLGGAFVLRVEDTDEQRSTEESTRAILDSLSWLGMDWDEGPDPRPGHFSENIGPHAPYFQSQRSALQLKAVQQLFAEGKVFYCSATEAELTGADGKRLLFSPYRDLSPDAQREALEKARAEGRGLPVRFKCPRGQTIEWQDIVRGPVSFQSDELGDFVIYKSSGQALYNFAVICDDHDMGITHVLRGEDHISNTPKQILMYEALGWPVPQFGHVPLIVGMDRARLSKRHGATRVEAYREMGVLPEALANFLALIGWAPSGQSAAANQELFSLAELIRYFNPEEIGKSSGAFNIEKLHHFNGLYIRALTPEQFFERLAPYLPEGWIEYRGAEYAQAACELFQDKLTLLAEIEQNAWYFFRDPADSDFNQESVQKFLVGNADAPRAIGRLYPRLEALPAARWTHAELEPIVDALCGELALGKGKLMQPWRVALTGDKVSPGFYDLLSVLGRETVLRRAAPWMERLGAL